MLSPELPKDVPEKIESLFESQTSPLYSFNPNYKSKDSFTEAFEKRIWRAKNQRFNVGMLPDDKLDIENISVAKTITGWIEQQR